MRDEMIEERDMYLRMIDELEGGDVVEDFNSPVSRARIHTVNTMLTAIINDINMQIENAEIIEKMLTRMEEIVNTS